MTKKFRTVRAVALSASLLASTSIGAVAQGGMIGNNSGSPIEGAGRPMGVTQPFGAATSGGTAGASTPCPSPQPRPTPPWNSFRVPPPLTASPSSLSKGRAHRPLR